MEKNKTVIFGDYDPNPIDHRGLAVASARAFKNMSAETKKKLEELKKDLDRSFAQARKEKTK